MNNRLLGFQMQGGCQGSPQGGCQGTLPNVPHNPPNVPKSGESPGCIRSANTLPLITQPMSACQAALYGYY